MAHSRSRLGLVVRWSWRDLRRRWLLVVTIALISALGIGTFTGLGGTSAWRIESQDASYAALAMHDLQASLPDGTFVPAGRLADAVTSIPDAAAVAAVEERLVVPVQVDASTDDEVVLVPGRLVSTEPDATVDQLHMIDGSPLPDDAGERPVAVLESKFADAHDLPAQGSVVLSGNRVVDYVGTGYGPEYFRVIGTSGQWATEKSFAVLFLPLASTQALLDQPDRVNDVVVRLAPDADVDAVIGQLADALGAVGAEVTTASDDLVRRALYEDAENDQRFWNLFAVIILAGASLAAFNLISRVVESERREIGVGMALGAPRALLAARHFLLGLQVALFGLLAGIGVGMLAAAGMRSVLTEVLPLPIWSTPFPAGRYLQGAVLGLVLPLVAVAIPVWRALRVEPVDALRTIPGGSRGAGLAPVAARLRGNTLRWMPLRNLLRASRRTAATAVGVAAGITCLVAVLGLLDTLDVTLERVDDELGQDTPNRLNVSLDQFRLADTAEVRAITSAAGVARSAATARIPGTLVAGGEEIDTFIELIDPETAVWQPTVVDGEAAGPDGGIVISEKAASDLEVSPGDEVVVRHVLVSPTLDLRLVDEPTVVTGVHPNPLRVLSYEHADRAAAFGLPGVVNQVAAVPATGVSQDELKRELFELPGVAAVEPAADVGQLLRDRLDAVTQVIRMLEAIVLVLVLLVAFNSAAIGLDERAREQATMFAFGVRMRTTMRILVVESLLIGLLGTVLGLVGGYFVVSWMTSTLVERVIPDLGLVATLSTTTLVVSLVLGAVAVAVAPLFTLRRLRHMDIPATLRVLE